MAGLIPAVNKLNSCNEAEVNSITGNHCTRGLAVLGLILSSLLST